MNRRVEKLSATVFGIGYFPVAPGTWASLAAVLVWWLLHWQIEFNFELQFVFVAASILIGLWSSIRLENVWEKDPSKIVIDEWAGMWVTCLFLPPDWRLFLAALVCFRILDIWKPLFIKKAEKLKGGWGVMMDDILAGIIGNLLIHTFLWIA